MRSMFTLSTAANCFKWIFCWCYRKIGGAVVSKRRSFVRSRRCKVLLVITVLLSLVLLGIIRKDDHFLGIFSSICHDLAGHDHSETIQTMRQQKWFIAALLKNNVNILPNWLLQIEKFINLVGRSSVFVSIVENGDSVDGTGDLLRGFAKKLTEMNVPHQISFNHSIETFPRFRVTYLADMRTAALLPLRQLVASKVWNASNTRIIFLNDIVFTVYDLIELISTNQMDYDIACAMDFAMAFYDVAVSRDLDDNRLLDYYPFFKDAAAIEQVHSRKPVRVFACWNGVVVMRPEPFVRPGNKLVPSSSALRFRDLLPGVDSECFIICKDYWLRGYNMILINPQVKVAYAFRYYFLHQFLPWNQFYFTQIWYSATNHLKPANRFSKLLTRDGNLEIMKAKNWTTYN